MEPITVLECRLGLFPAKFSWRGQIYRVEAVAECKTETTPSGRSRAYHFWVRCQGRLWHLSRQLASGQWVMQYD